WTCLGRLQFAWSHCSDFDCRLAGHLNSVFLGPAILPSVIPLEGMIPPRLI
ncbi:hypothetical protein FCV25MIE_33666, partial [Fagus crenata]